MIGITTLGMKVRITSILTRIDDFIRGRTVLNSSTMEVFFLADACLRCWNNRVGYRRPMARTAQAPVRAVTV